MLALSVPVKKAVVVGTIFRITVVDYVAESGLVTFLVTAPGNRVFDGKLFSLGVNDELALGKGVRVVNISARANHATLGFEGPMDLPIDREEIAVVKEVLTQIGFVDFAPHNRPGEKRRLLWVGTNETVAFGHIVKALDSGLIALRDGRFLWNSPGEVAVTMEELRSMAQTAPRVEPFRTMAPPPVATDKRRETMPVFPGSEPKPIEEGFLEQCLISAGLARRPNDDVPLVWCRSNRSVKADELLSLARLGLLNVSPHGLNWTRRGSSAPFDVEDWLSLHEPARTAPRRNSTSPART